jgi:hypothetical protein
MIFVISDKSKKQYEKVVKRVMKGEVMNVHKVINNNNLYILLIFILFIHPLCVHRVFRVYMAPLPHRG